MNSEFNQIIKLKTAKQRHDLVMLLTDSEDQDSSRLSQLFDWVILDRFPDITTDNFNKMTIFVK